MQTLKKNGKKKNFFSRKQGEKLHWGSKEKEKH
jgi:hypothetical protein